MEESVNIGNVVYRIAFCALRTFFTLRALRTGRTLGTGSTGSAGIALLAFFALRALRTGRTLGTGSTGITLLAFLALGTGITLFAFLALFTLDTLFALRTACKVFGLYTVLIPVVVVADRPYRTRRSVDTVRTVRTVCNLEGLAVAQRYRNAVCTAFYVRDNASRFDKILNLLYCCSICGNFLLKSADVCVVVVRATREKQPHRRKQQDRR